VYCCIYALKGETCNKLVYFYSVTMATRSVPLVKQGCTTDVPLVDKSLEILGVWHWKRWLNHLSYLASTSPLDVQKSFHTTASLSMRQYAIIDHIVALMLDQSVLSWEIFPSLLHI